jgi:hypothetical protein
VPDAGIELGGRAYVVVKTNHADEESAATDLSILTRYEPKENRFEKIRTISTLPGGHFIKVVLHREAGELAGLPEGGPWLLMFGTGERGKSSAYVAAIPVVMFERSEGTRYFAGVENGKATWSTDEAKAAPIVDDPVMGDMSVTWAANAALWVMTYDVHSPAAAIMLRTAPSPWGPWSAPETIFDAKKDGFGKFIHDPSITPPDGLAGPMIGKEKEDPESVRGNVYAPYVVERFTRFDAPKDRLTIHWLLSTWNPYTVVHMRSDLDFVY